MLDHPSSFGYTGSRCVLTHRHLFMCIPYTIAAELPRGTMAIRFSMYQKYHTEALVLGSRERGESDRVYALYTREFGLVRARASAVRSEGSRMRYALQHYALVRVSLVRGKNGWRAAGALAIDGIQPGKGSAVFARVAGLVLRLVAGEERNDFLFDTLTHARAFLTRGDVQMVPTVELVCVARVLFALGYISAEALETAIFTHTAYSMEHLREADAMRDKLLSSVNRALSETHL